MRAGRGRRRASLDAPNDPAPRISESLCIRWIVQVSSEHAVRPWDGLGVHGAHCSPIGRVVRSWDELGRFGRPSDGLFVHGTHCSFIGRFGRPYGTVSSWRHHALPCSGEAALAAQRCWNAALYPLSLPWQRWSLHFDRHANRRHSAVFPFPLGKGVETGTIGTQRSM